MFVHHKSKWLGLILASHAVMFAVGNPTGVRVRLVYLSNGKPAANQKIILYQGDPSKKATVSLSGKTAADGTFTFDLQQEQPETIWVDTENGQIRACAWEPQLSIKTVEQEGITIVADSRFGQTCKGDRNIANQLAAKPGEIVIFVKKLTTWENLTHY